MRAVTAILTSLLFSSAAATLHLHAHNAALDIAAAASAAASRPSYNFSVPVDHFHNDSRYEPHSDESFPLRYWLDDQYYRPGGPVIVLAAGEVTGVARIPFLEHGIVKILAEALGGLGVVLEHRYYGTSYPVPDLSVDNLRFLSTDQALADTAYFARNIKYAGLEHLNLTSKDAPYILYGGSYAGAFVAFARKLYPDVFWGAVSSSGVTAVVDDFWQYFEAARLFSPAKCSENHQRLVHIFDNILLGDDEDTQLLLKRAFGLEDLNDQDFVSTLTKGISGLQNVVWDPAVSEDDYANYCAALIADTVVYPSLEDFVFLAVELVEQGGYEKDIATVTQLLNFIGYMRADVGKEMEKGCKGKTIKECYQSKGQIDNISIPQDMRRAWVYQTCKQWGYFITGSSVPDDRLPMISRLIDYPYASSLCRDAFNITARPDTESINRLGGFDFSFPRVALIDGEADPWRQATPHAIDLDEGRRESTVEEPFLLIGGLATHHWDEFGLRKGGFGPGLPPTAVRDVQRAEIDFVRAWLADWAASREGHEVDDGAGAGTPEEL